MYELLWSVGVLWSVVVVVECKYCYGVYELLWSVEVPMDGSSCYGVYVLLWSV